ncbi:nuclear transport factor 2 family protein [Actinoplanes sp. NPDC051470]|uniref:nuclear transport factor 2 family protein n=1 Tax=unclassified Actinoplanes TaxID=2626549 RepID=UPI003440EE96
MSIHSEEIFQRYIHAGALTRDPDAVAALFTEDGVYEVPLTSHKLVGREAIRAGIGAYQQEPVGTPDLAKTRFVLHRTTDPDVFIAEIDAALNTPSGPRNMSLVQIFRTRDGLICHLRDYFAMP